MVGLGAELPMSIPDECIYAYYRDGKPIGTAAYIQNIGDGEDSIRIYIYAAKEFRRRGIGTKLYRFIMRQIDTEHYDVVSGAVIEGGGCDQAYEFCRSLGAEDWQALYRMRYSGPSFPVSIELVPYRDEYYEELARSKFESWRALSADYGFDAVPYSAREREEWRRDAGNIFVRLSETGRPIAMCSCGENGHMHGLFVSDEYKGQGLGRSILMYCINRAFERGNREVELSVLTRNPAKRMYLELGFRAFETEHYFRFSKCVKHGS